MPTRLFGAIPGVPVGAAFDSRAELAAAGIHKPRQAGISGSIQEGADSIVVSGGYEDDQDFGGELIYTGHGGQDPITKKQVAHQTLTHGNLALAVSSDRGIPVRVVRGSKGDPAYSPPSGFSYDGLYRVEGYTKELGHSGFDVYRFRLVRSPEENPVTNPPPGPSPRSIGSSYATIQRLVRNTAASEWVKRLYGYRCQICAERLQTSTGPYAEGAHVRPVGRPHDGPDEAANILCLCPNDHVRFDRGVIGIDDDLQVRALVDGSSMGRLTLDPGHGLNLGHAAYHRAIHRPDR